MKDREEQLTPNERAALAELEFELSAPHTLEEIATHLGVSVRHVTRIESRALDKMRSLIESGDWEEGLQEPAPLGRRVGWPMATNGASTTPWSDGGQHDGSRS